MLNTVVASIATMKEREESLKLTVQSLDHQVDKINIYLHGYNEIPQWIKENKKIEVGQGADNADNDKFFWVPRTTGFHLICDDDIIYPDDYVEKVKRDLAEYEYKAVISYLGVIPHRLPIASYYLDRDKVGIFEELENDTEVKILGTGCLAYYTESPLQFYYTEKPLFMSDILFSTFLAEVGIQRICCAHKADWFKYTPPKEGTTIFEKEVTTDYIQTKWINDRPELFQTEKIPYEFPKVTVAVVVSRLRTQRDEVKQCLDSLRKLSYPNYEIVMIDNNDRLLTIGKCYNDAARIAKGEYILYVGDDDYITSDYLYSLVTMLQSMPHVIHSTTYLSMFDKEGNVVPKELVPTGMFKVDYIKNNPFAEYLTRYVDSDMFERMREQDHGSLVARHQYGYWYRSHEEQVSGAKILGNAHENGTRAEISPILAKIRNSFKETIDESF